jgi:hypothetical protein
MKTKLVIIIVLIVFFFASCEQKNAMESSFPYEPLIRTKVEIMNMERPKDSYNYPVYPGMKAWAELATGEEQVKACQVPEDVLKTMSTQAVIQALWEYPLLVNVFHRYQYRHDFESLCSTNNAFRELCTRKDAGISLLERMTAVNPLISVPESGCEFELLEMLTCQDVFLFQLDAESKTALVEIALEKDGLRQQNAGFADRPERAITWLLLGKTMLNAGYSPFVAEVNGNEDLKSFFTGDMYVYLEPVYDNIPQIITEHAIGFIQTSKIQKL